MAVERMTIISVNEDALHIRAGDRNHCGRCAAKAGCGQQLLHNLLGTDTQTLSLPRCQVPDADYSPGDKVDVHIDDGRIAGFSLLIYVAPIIAVVLATAAARLVTASTGAGEIWVVGAASLALIIGLAGVRAFSARLGNNLYSMLDVAAVAMAASAITVRDH